MGATLLSLAQFFQFAYELIALILVRATSEGYVSCCRRHNGLFVKGLRVTAFRRDGLVRWILYFTLKGILSLDSNFISSFFSYPLLGLEMSKVCKFSWAGPLGALIWSSALIVAVLRSGSVGSGGELSSGIAGLMRFPRLHFGFCIPSIIHFFFEMLMIPCVHKLAAVNVDIGRTDIVAFGRFRGLFVQSVSPIHSVFATSAWFLDKIISKRVYVVSI